MSYRKVEETVRPYRLWNSKDNKEMRYRYYSDPKRAHMGALIECRWAKVGVTIEVYNCQNLRMLGQYTRRVDRIDFSGE